MQAVRAGARLFRPACNLARAGGALGRSAAQPSTRVLSVAAYASPSTFLEKTEVVDRVTGLLRSSPCIDPTKVPRFFSGFQKDGPARSKNSRSAAHNLDLLFWKEPPRTCQVTASSLLLSKIRSMVSFAFHDFVAGDSDSQFGKGFAVGHVG